MGWLLFLLDHFQFIIIFFLLCLCLLNFSKLLWIIIIGVLSYFIGTWLVGDPFKN